MEEGERQALTSSPEPHTEPRPEASSRGIVAFCAVVGCFSVAALALSHKSSGSSTHSVLAQLNQMSAEESEQQSAAAESCGKGCEKDDDTPTALFDDDKLSGLICAEFDDDGVYPSHFCNYGDSKTCAEKVVTSDMYSQFCGSTCVQAEENMVESGNKKTSEYVNASWAVYCGWQAVANMDTACNSLDSSTGVTWEPTKPSGSNNMDPSSTYSEAMKDEVVDGEDYDACNLHAFCSACTEDGGKSINANCKSMVDKYGKGAIYMVTTFFNSLEDFWCTDAVQNAIANGTFAEEYGKTDDV